MLKNELYFEKILFGVLQLFFNFFSKQRQVFSSENKLHR